jgi:hypothetical protein
MKGKPNLARYAALSSPIRASSCGVHAVRPARVCSSVEEAVSERSTIAWPASSGCAHSSFSCASRPASRTTSTSARLSCASVANGRRGAAASTTHGECS